MNTKKVTVFNNLIKNQDLLKYLKEQTFQKPTNVQSQAISPIISGGNFVVQGKTGSGKTLAFLLPLFENLKSMEESDNDILASNPKSIILAPTRELAIQIFSISKDISHFCKLRVRKLIGGDKGRPLQSLFSSKIDILIATPERIIRAVNNDELQLNELKFLVFDEADQLLEKSFRQPVFELAKKINEKETNIKIHLFSATKPENFEETIKEYFPSKTFQIIGKGEENRIGHNVKTTNYNTNEDDKLYLLDSFIKKVPKSNGIIFVGNRFRSQVAYDKLLKMGIKKIYLIHKEIEKNDRTVAMNNFKKNGGIIIATDILARGIDISHLHWVLNFDLPSDGEYYLHRTGRVGRAGKKGEVFNFVTQKDSQRQQRINIALQSQGRLDLKLPEIKLKSTKPDHKSTQKISHKSNYKSNQKDETNQKRGKRPAQKNIKRQSKKRY